MIFFLVYDLMIINVLITMVYSVLICTLYEFCRLFVVEVRQYYKSLGSLLDASTNYCITGWP